MLRRYDPDLEDPGRPRLEIVFGVPDARSGSHHLHVACLGTALVAEAVLVRDGALADVGDDFHVGVGMRRKSRVGGDLVIVPYPQSAPAQSGRVPEFAEGKVVLGLQPAMICRGELIESAAVVQRCSPREWPCAPLYEWTDTHIEHRSDPNIP